MDRVTTLILRVHTYPDPILLRRAEEVEKITSDIVRLMDDMAETMYASKGVGLAAPQVGVSKRVIVIDAGVDLPSGKKGRRLIQMANPVIVASSGEIVWEEGCLSVPEFLITIKRKRTLSVQGLDKTGKMIEIMADELLAIAFQHEIDHIDGRLIIDRVPKAVRERYLKNTGSLLSQG
jgi:peptide deformylase